MILVTGGTGLVGSHLLYRLISTNKNVKAIFRNKKKLDIVKKVNLPGLSHLYSNCCIPKILNPECANGAMITMIAIMVMIECLFIIHFQLLWKTL